MRASQLACLLVVSMVLSGCTYFDRVTQVRPGSAAEDLVSTRTYDNLVVEIDHPAGSAPSQTAIDTLKAALADVTQKKRIDVVLDASVPATKKAYTYDEIESLEKQHRNRHSGGEDAVLYILYLAGTSAENHDTLGAAYAGTSLVIFQGRIKEAATATLSNPTPPRAEFIERSVLVHEFGHAAGLVNLGAPMVKAREDPERRGHSSDKGSVMYWAVENTDGLLSLFTGGSGIPYQFTADDKADLRGLWAS